MLGLKRHSCWAYASTLDDLKSAVRSNWFWVKVWKVPSRKFAQSWFVALVPEGLVGAEETAPYVPSLVPPSEFSCFLILEKLTPYLVVCVPKTLESVANSDLLNEKSL